ncbi:hypothetical protein PR202_ga11748 [Eleusine coracana subsp. coracana]|uniref:Uncharacterized protein n=1 Tax=Eleusine coracana subsp. coracana TaxID=191504 RepID=A0AAV5CA90_ELECO|nr:hypothetical protein QOZ80_5AG0399460 [Eleusine coracana subsp. coracana]GJM95052.1 hypothetical protein PR202_ga11748 [Eleusine coracana subsp. coracana]
MPTLAAAASPGCAPFPFRRGGATARTRGMPGHGGQGCGRPLGRAAGVVGGGIAAAFFASLERCSCVEVRTKEEDDDDADAEAAAPLMHRGGGSPTTTTAATASRGRRTTGKGGKRRGLGCCENGAVN